MGGTGQGVSGTGEGWEVWGGVRVGQRADQASEGSGSAVRPNPDPPEQINKDLCR